MLHAIILFREATEILKTKASRLPDCAPGVRLQRIAARLGEFSNSLERAAMAIERGHHRKSPTAVKGELDLAGLEAMLTNSLRGVPIGSRKGRQLYALRSRVRGILASGPVENRGESSASIPPREIAKQVPDLSARGAA